MSDLLSSKISCMASIKPLSSTVSPCPFAPGTSDKSPNHDLREQGQLSLSVQLSWCVIVVGPNECGERRASARSIAWFILYVGASYFSGFTLSRGLPRQPAPSHVAAFNRGDWDHCAHLEASTRYYGDGSLTMIDSIRGCTGWAQLENRNRIPKSQNVSISAFPRTLASFQPFRIS